MELAGFDDAYSARMPLVGVPPTDAPPPAPPPQYEPPPLPPATAVPATHAVYPESVPAVSMPPSQPFPVFHAQPPAEATYVLPAAPLAPAPAPEPGYLEALALRRRDVQKLVILALMVTLGIALHWVATRYLDGWLEAWPLTGRQELLLRGAYPATVLFLIWNLKAFGFR